MADETANRPAQVRNTAGDDKRGRSEQSPLQSRAAFLANWDWESVACLNRTVCERGRAQHGTNSESVAVVRQEWLARRLEESSLIEALDYLKSCHRRAPFLFFNGNTFADIARTFSDYLFAELPHVRRREAVSAVAHYIAGVLDFESMAGIVESLCESANLKPGDNVKTLRGSTHGVIRRIQKDGRVVWTPAGSQSELIALPESLILDKKQKK